MKLMVAGLVPDYLGGHNEGTIVAEGVQDTMFSFLAE